MVSVLIMGSSGMVGSEVLDECLKNPKVKRITVVNRKSSVSDKKVREIIHADFLDFSGIKKEIINHDVCFYCVGVYQGDVPKDEFITITHDYLIALAEAIESRKTVFCLFSAQGANPSSNVLFEKWKGQAEADLMKFGFKQMYIFRPGYIHPSNKERMRKAIFYRIFEFFYPIANIFLPWFCTNSRQLAKTMVSVGLNGFEKRIFENKDIRGFGITDLNH